MSSGATDRGRAELWLSVTVGLSFLIWKMGLGFSNPCRESLLQHSAYQTNIRVLLVFLLPAR